jgi:hypothetical protein
LCGPDSVPHIRAMGKVNEVDFRIAVGSASGPRSNIWRGVSTNDCVYVMHPQMGKIVKFSFHRSCRCRVAFTEIEGPGQGESDRVIEKWKRSPAPRHDVAYALVARFPTDFLSTALPSEPKEVTWIPAAPPGSVTLVEFLFTKDDEQDARVVAERANRSMVSYTRLPNGDAFFVTWHHGEKWNGESFVAPGVLRDDCELVVSRRDPDDTGRPVRFTMFVPAPNRTTMMADEFGAYYVPKGTKFAEPMGRFTRTKLLKRNNSATRA